VDNLSAEASKLSLRGRLSREEEPDIEACSRSEETEHRKDDDEYAPRLVLMLVMHFYGAFDYDYSVVALFLSRS